MHELSSYFPTEVWNLIASHLSDHDLKDLSKTSQNLYQLFQEKIKELNNRAIFFQNLSSKNEARSKLQISEKKLNLDNFKMVHFNHKDYFRGSSVDKFLVINPTQQNLIFEEAHIKTHPKSKYSSPSISSFDLHTKVGNETLTWLNDEFLMLTDTTKGTVQIINKELESIFCSLAKHAFFHNNHVYLRVNKTLHIVPIEKILAGADIDEVMDYKEWDIFFSANWNDLFAMTTHQKKLIIYNLDKLSQPLLEMPIRHPDAQIKFLSSQFLVVDNCVLNLSTREQIPLYQEGSNFTNFQLNQNNLLTYDAIIEGKHSYVIQDVMKRTASFFSTEENSIRVPYKDVFFNCSFDRISEIKSPQATISYKVNSITNIEAKTLKIYHGILFFIHKTTSNFLVGLDYTSKKIVFNKKIRKFSHFDISNGNIYLARICTNKHSSASKRSLKTMKVTVLIMNRAIAQQNNTNQEKKADRLKKSLSK